MTVRSNDILELINLINTTFGSNSPSVSKHWDSYSAIGFEKGMKLIYLDIYKPDDIYCECEILDRKLDVGFTTVNTYNSITTERVLEIMSEFFEIEKIK